MIRGCDFLQNGRGSGHCQPALTTAQAGADADMDVTLNGVLQQSNCMFGRRDLNLK